MSSQAAVIRVAESLIPLPPEAYPKNLSRTQREDSPENMYPVLAYEGQNILPTPFGYRSYFATNEKLLRDAVARILPTVRCENIFWYQSAQLDNALIALASDGIYITNTDVEADWIKVVDLSALDTDPLVRRQWSFCTINNITFMYLQGAGSFYGLVDSARYAEAATPSIIVGSTVSQVAQHWNVGVLSYTPTFLNMAGQVGLFKAGNRLGFWDSDNSVSWSSALYVEDFTPSVTTLAGFSKFADIVGTITKICQHGDGFIIYCTRSIIGVINNTNERSKFNGRAILSNTGVLFDRQIAVAQPDNIHYALTSSGLYTIINQQPEAIATDIIDGLVEANDYLSLDFIDGRYLFINTINGWEGSKIDFEAATGTDFDGNEFRFPPVTYPNPEDASALVDNYLKGLNQSIQDALKDYEPIVDLSTIPEDSVLQPCFNISIFESTWADTTFTPVATGTEILDSKIRLGTTYFLDKLYNEAVVTVNSITAKNIMPGNFAGQEAYNEMNKGMTNFNNQIDYQNAWLAANQTPYAVNIFTPAAGSNDPVVATKVVWEKQLLERRLYPYQIDSRDLEAVANECRLELYLNKTRLAELLVYFEGVETFTPGGVYIEFGGFGYVEGPTQRCVEVNFVGSGSSCMKYEPFSVEQAFDTDINHPPAAVLAPAGLSYYVKFFDYIAAISPTYSTTINSREYAYWALHFYPELCTVIGVDKQEYIEILATARQAWTTVQLARGLNVSTPGSHNQILVHPVVGWAPPEGSFYSKNLGANWLPKGSYPSQTSGTFQVTAYQALDFGVATANDGNTYRSSVSGFVVQLTQLPNELRPPLDNGNVVTAISGYRLQGVVFCERELFPSFPQKHTIYSLEVSGFGYYPSGGFSFRKTHNRHSSTSCPLPGPGWPSTFPEPPVFKPIGIDVDTSVTPPYQWEYPDSIPLPPNYWLTKKGSASPLYPTFIRSLIYDAQLEKWGIADMPFKALCALSPVNRTDDTIAPKHDYGMLAAVLNPDGSVSTLRPNNPQGEICYGKIGQWRLGKTKMAYLKCHFKEKFTGTLVVETSLDGRTVAPQLTKAADFTGVLSARFPFTMSGEWFNIKIRGDFALSHIECFIEGRSRR